MQVKFDFLNWRPDAEDLRNPGLTTADNVIHDAEGYKKVSLPTSGAFATNQPVSNDFTACLDVIYKPIGNSGELVAAWISNSTTTTAALRIGAVSHVGHFTTVSMATLASINAASLDFFAVAQLDQQFVMSAKCTASKLSGGSTAYSAAGTVAYSITSV